MRSGRSHQKGGNRILWKIHHWCGLYSGILIGVLSITGALAVFIPEIDAFIKKTYYQATSSPAGDGLPEFGKSFSELTRRYPGYQSVSVELPRFRGEVAEIGLSVPAEGGGSQYVSFFVDTGEDRIVGSRLHKNSLANYMRQMHVRLYEGNWGRQLVGLGGVALTVLVITGLLIYGNFMKKQVWPAVRKGRGLRILMADWHKLLGIAALAFNLVIGLTGAWLGLQPYLMRVFDIRTPNAHRLETVMGSEEDKQLAIDWETALKAAKEEFPDLEVLQINCSGNGSAAITFRGSIKGTVYERGINTLVLSKQTLRPLWKYDVREAPFSHRFYFIQEALHFGDFGGLAVKLLYALLGLVSAFLSISGFVIFLYRSRPASQRNARPALLVTFYSLGIILLLVLAALVSLFIGYDQAAFSAAVLINGLLIVLLAYAVVKFLADKWKQAFKAVKT